MSNNMELEGNPTGPQNPQKVAKGKPQRKPKEGNTQLFNELLSAANALSVNERTRLVRSLAGQLSLVVIGSGELLAKGTQKPKSEKGEKIAKRSVRPNPLKGTHFEVEKEKAFKALIEAKNAAGGAKLPSDHPAVVNYNKALSAYKEAQKAMQLVAGNTSDKTPQQSVKRAKVKTSSDGSPEPVSTRASGIIGRIHKVVSSVTKSKTLEDPDDEKIL